MPKAIDGQTPRRGTCKSDLGLLRREDTSYALLRAVCGLYLRELVRENHGKLFDRHTLRQIARLINIAPTADGDVIRDEL